MKTALYLLILLSLTFSACDKEEKEQTEPRTPHLLDGEWHLLSVTCLCPPVELEEGDNTWTIDVADGELVVADNTGGISPYIPASGEYLLTVTEDSLFYGISAYAMEMIEDELHLHHMPELDGPIILLHRGTP